MCFQTLSKLSVAGDLSDILTSDKFPATDFSKTAKKSETEVSTLQKSNQHARRRHTQHATVGDGTLVNMAVARILVRGVKNYGVGTGEA